MLNATKNLLLAWFELLKEQVQLLPGSVAQILDDKKIVLFVQLDT